MSKKPKRPRLYDIVTGTRVGSQRDPLDKLMEDEAKDLASEARRLRLEEIIENRKRKLSRARQGSPIMGDDSNQLLNLMNLMNKQLETGIKIASSQGGGSNTDEVLGYLKIFSDLLKDKGSSTDPNWIDTYVKGREAGLFSNPGTAEHNAFSVQLEQIRTERMMESRKIDLELKKLGLESEERNQRLSMVLSGLSPILAVFGAKTAENMRRTGQDVASRRYNPNNPSPEVAMLGSFSGETGEMRLACSCGYDKVLVVPIPPPPSLSCPGCGKQLATALQPGSDDEEGAEWRGQA